MRLRQFVFVAEDLKAAVVDIGATLGLPVCFNGPNVGRFGLQNVLLPIGGDGGYMIILECDDALAHRERIAALGVREIWRYDDDDCHATHFHPKDVPGAILSIDDMGPEGDPNEELSRWKWAGPNWQEFVQTQDTKALTAVEIQCDDPGALAKRWGEVLDIPVESISGKPAVQLDNAHIRFVADTDGRGIGICAIDVLPANKENILRIAHKLDLVADDDQIVLCGVRVNLV